MGQGHGPSSAAMGYGYHGEEAKKLVHVRFHAKMAETAM